MSLKRILRIGLAYLMQLAIAFVFLFSIIERNYSLIIVSGVSLFITFIPLFLKRKWRVTLPWSLNLLILFSLVMYVLGIYSGWYQSMHPYFYDKISHFLGSITIALLGLTSVLIIDRYTEVELTNKSIIFFVIIFTLAVGAFWEIAEFTVDLIFKTNSQYDGLSGTMYDLVFDLFGGVVAGVIAHFKLRKGKEKFIDKLLKIMRVKRIKCKRKQSQN